MRSYIINTLHRKSRIAPEIYGHFAEHLGRCVYEGLYIGKDSPIPNREGIRRDVVEALRRIRIPVLRWPGGCFADTYHWRDGVGPARDRKPIANVFWGGVTEDNSFGTHEFMLLCELLGCQPYIAGNLGSGTVQEMSEWVQYLTFRGDSPMAALRAANGRKEPWRLKYFGVGNENWGCGGNMTADEYAREYKQYRTYLSDTPDNKLYRIACGPSDRNYDWMETLLRTAGRHMDGISLHYYTVAGPDWNHKGSALGFPADRWYTLLARALDMEEILRGHERVLDRYDPEGRIGLVVDEWGTWHDVEPGTNPAFLYQQNSMRDALAAAVTLNTFNRHSARVVMANLAQLANVLQAPILTQGPRMVTTPTYHVFDLYQTHQGATLVDTFLQTEEIGPQGARVPDLHESASIDEQGRLTVTVANLSPDSSTTLDASVVGREAQDLTARMIRGAVDAHNTFDAPDTVRPEAFTDYRVTDRGFEAELPPSSVVVFTSG